MTAEQRIALALDSLGPDGCVSRLADEHDVSRKFVYQQRHKARQALREAFDPADRDREVLSYLPVTKDWLRQLVLVAVLAGRTSPRGVAEMLQCLLGLAVSLGWVHSVVKDAIAEARPLDDRADLSRVRSAALDEIFQDGRPVLAVADVESTYCCLSRQEPHRDGDTWGVALLDLRAQGFAPAGTIADGGKGLRSGVQQAPPYVDRDADVWHCLRDVGEAARYLEDRAYDAIAAADECQRRSPREPGDAAPRARAEAARLARREAIALAEDVALMLPWLRHDVLGVAGPSLARRQELFDFVLLELMRRRASCEHRLGRCVRCWRTRGRSRWVFASGWTLR